MSALELFRQNLAQITKIDNVLDSLEDSQAAGKRKITNELIAKETERAKPVADQIISSINSAPSDDIKFPLYLALVKFLEDEFSKAADAYVVSQIPAVDPNAEKPEVSDSERKALIDQRKALTERARIVGDMAVDMGEITREEYEAQLPKRRNLSGPRGKRAISFYVLTVDGVKYDSLAEVAKAHGYDKAKDLTAAIRTEVKDGETVVYPGVNLTDPPREFEFTMKNGKVLKASDTRTDEQRNEKPETPDSEDNSDEDDETTDE